MVLYSRQRPCLPSCRGVVLEALGRFDEAVRDYQSVLAVQPNDPAGWNNLGNATRGLGQWQVCPHLWYITQHIPHSNQQQRPHGLDQVYDSGNFCCSGLASECIRVDIQELLC